MHSRSLDIGRPGQRRPSRGGSCATGALVQPIYVSVGLAWEAAERAAVRTLLAVEPLARPHAAAGVVDRRHARRLRGRPLGDRRNALPLTTRPTRTCICPAATSSCWERPACTAPRPASIGSCSARSRTIRSPTRRPRFARRWRTALSLGLAHPLAIDAPFAGIGKAEVIRRGAALGVPLQLTLSCMSPREQEVLEVRAADL